MSMYAYLGEVRIFSVDFVPPGWAACDGGVLPIAQHKRLFSLIGTSHGGDGVKTFALPDLRGRAVMGWGAGPRLTARRLSERGGQEEVRLTPPQLPTHEHSVLGFEEEDRSAGELQEDPTNGCFAANPEIFRYGPSAGDQNVDMAPEAVAAAGGGQAHENMQPFLVLNFAICLVGQTPSYR